MRDHKVFILTDLGKITLNKQDHSISGNEKRLMQLLDGKRTIEAVRKSASAAVRYDLEQLLNHLLHKLFIVEVHGFSDTLVKKEPVVAQSLYLEMRLLAEMEIKRREAREQELAQTRLQLLEVQSRLQNVTEKYTDLKNKAMLFQPRVNKKITLQKTQADVSQDGLTEDAELGKRRMALDIMQDMVLKQSADMDETIRQRLVVAQSAEQEKRKQNKIEAENRVRSHPHYARIRGLDFFKKFRNSDLDALLEWAEWVKVKTGETVIAEGELGLPFYVVVSGRLIAVKNKRILSVLKSGHSFGEIAYLDDENPQRDVSVVAQTECELLMLEPAHLENAELMLRMNIAEALVRMQAKRLRRTVDTVVRMLN